MVGCWDMRKRVSLVPGHLRSTLWMAMAGMICSLVCGCDSNEPSPEPESAPDGGTDDGAAGSGGSHTGGSNAAAGAAGTAGAGGLNEGTWSFEKIREASAKAAGQDWAIELYAAHRPDGQTSYLMYIPPAQPTSGVVVITQPYLGIDWTGEEVDERWAALGPGQQPDVDSPGYDGNDLITYAPQTIEEAAEDAAIHLLNGHAVVHAYGRFYAGGDLEDDIQDATAPYYFLKEQSLIDNVGVIGASWGGMRALFGTSRAPAEVNIRAVAALCPPSDFADMVEWVTMDLPSSYPQPDDVETFFSPYLRRIRASVATGASEDYSPYQPPALCAGLRGSILVPHDTWDTLVPYRETLGLVNTCPQHVAGLYWWRPEPIDYDAVGLEHGLFGKEPGYPTVYTFALSHLGLALSDGGQVLVIGHSPALVEFLTMVDAARAAGESTGASLEQVTQLTDPQMQVYDPVSEALVDGASFVADAVNQVWGTSYDSSNIAAGLSGGFPN